MEYQRNVEVFIVANHPKNQNLVLTRFVYRLTYAKQGRAKFISHLDLMRVITRTLRRAKLPVWYTQGFNPHPYIMFPLALALGTESEIEPMDIALLEDIPNDELMERMNEVLPEGLKIMSVSKPLHDHLEIKNSIYKIEIETDTTPDVTKEKFLEFINGETVEISKRHRDKKTKKISYRQIDVKEHIELLEIYTNDESTVISIKLSTSAGNDFNLNFAPVLDAFSEKSGIKITHISANRTKILCKNGEIFQ